MKPQDNPFAKGVSINQDMLTDEWQDAIDNGRVSIIHRGPGLILSKESALLQQEYENRKLLALGREEE